MSINGVDVDKQGRCTHWAGPTDVVATAFPCCDGWWACYRCHDEVQAHPAQPWPPARHDGLAILCGACHARVAIRYHLARDEDDCPHCGHAWNPACREHADKYFEV